MSIKKESIGAAEINFNGRAHMCSNVSIGALQNELGEDGRLIQYANPYSVYAELFCEWDFDGVDFLRSLEGCEMVPLSIMMYNGEVKQCKVKLIKGFKTTKLGETKNSIAHVHFDVFGMINNA